MNTHHAFNRNDFVCTRRNINRVGVVVDTLTVNGRQLCDVEFDTGPLQRFAEDDLMLALEEDNTRYSTRSVLYSHL